MAAGWIFRKEKYFALVAEPNEKEAKAIAVKHFGGEPDAKPQAMDQDLVNFLGMARGQMATAGIVNTVKM